METEVNARVSTGYLLIVLLLMLILPVVSIGIEYYTHSPLTLVSLIGKWFVFWAIGVRLFTAGFRQVIKPAFTLRNIFNIDSPDSTVIVKELGFANICFGAAAIISIFVPPWRPATGFTGGLYMGIAGINHIIKKASTPNEVIAMVSDIFIFAVIAVYLYTCVANYYPSKSILNSGLTLFFDACS